MSVRINFNLAFNKGLTGKKVQAVGDQVYQKLRIAFTKQVKHVGANLRRKT